MAFLIKITHDYSGNILWMFPSTSNWTLCFVGSLKQTLCGTFIYYLKDFDSCQKCNSSPI